MEVSLDWQLDTDATLQLGSWHDDSALQEHLGKVLIAVQPGMLCSSVSSDVVSTGQRTSPLRQALAKKPRVID